MTVRRTFGTATHTGFEPSWVEVDDPTLLLVGAGEDPDDVHARMHAIRDLVDSTDVLARLREAAQAAGYAGDPWIVELIFLVGATRLLAKPVCLAITGAASIGKSFALDIGLRTIPEEGIYRLTASSEKALIYTDEEFTHRLIVMEEAAGISGGIAAYILRSLISEGRLSYETTDFETKSTIKIQKEGPTGLILSTTGRIDAELATRMFEVAIDEGAVRTLDIIRREAQRASGELVDDRHRLCAFQMLQASLAMLDVEVIVPYASVVADLVDPKAPVRLRRDFRAILSLIRAHALLHYTHRSCDTRGRLLASLDDYAAVHRLTQAAVNQGAQAGVKPQVVETVAAVAEVLRGQTKSAATTADLQALLGVDDSTVRRRLKACLELGVLREADGKSGRGHRVILGEPLPTETEILPEPARVRDVWADA